MGRIGGAQTISVGNSDASIVCKHGNIVHEIAHSLGFFHEHSRPDRDDYVNILWDNIEGGEYTGTFSVTKVSFSVFKRLSSSGYVSQFWWIFGLDFVIRASYSMWIAMQ